MLSKLTLASIEAFIYRFSSLLITLLVASLSSLLIPIALILLGRVEVFRVADGVRLVDPARASIIALSLVAMYFLLQVVRSSLLLDEFQTMERPKHSLRHDWRSLWYFMGLWGWQEKHTTPLQSLEKAKNSVAVVIIVLGTLGSMHTKIATLEGRWYEALWSILSESSLLDFLTYLGGFAITAALLSALDWLIPYTFSEHRKSSQRVNITHGAGELYPDGTLFVMREGQSLAAELAEKKE